LPPQQRKCGIDRVCCGSISTPRASKRMRVVVTGASGLVGRYVAVDLDARGYEVICADRVVPDSLPGRSAVGDLTDMGHVQKVVAGAEVVIHLARVPFPYTWGGYDAASSTWRKPDCAGDARRFSTNLTIINNVLAAALAAGVRKVVIGSSLTVYGLYYPSRPVLPDYLPIDEQHPRRPDDPYSLTKLIGEQLADASVLWNSVQLASLRFPGVVGEDHSSFIDKRKSPMMRGIGGLWTYIDVRDAANACRLAFERDFSGHEAFNICAPTTFMRERTAELVGCYLPRVTIRDERLDGNWAGYDTQKAAKILGFEALHLLKP
jgi:UDP-glucose 4-epimerase